MSDPRDELDQIRAEAEISHSRVNVDQLAEALEAVLKLSKAWDAAADRIQGSVGSRGYTRARAIQSVVADMRDAIQAKLAEKEQETADHPFLPVAGVPDDDECTHRDDGTDDTYCGLPESDHEWSER